MRKLRQLTAGCLLTACVLFGGGGTAEAAVLTEGMRGAVVSDLQSRLTDLGYNPGGVDGIFGVNTVVALENFQRDHGLTADGVAGEQTLNALLRAEDRGQDISASRGGFGQGLAGSIIAESKKYLGVPYVFGGQNPGGFDCSGFVQYVFAQRGVQLPRTADVQYGTGVSVAGNSLQPGDLVFFSTYLPGPSHVGIYLGSGQFINAQSSKGVAIASLSSNYWANRYIGARRILR